MPDDTRPATKNEAQEFRIKLRSHEQRLTLLEERMHQMELSKISPRSPRLDRMTRTLRKLKADR